jgi:hypothetical protein
MSKRDSINPCQDEVELLQWETEFKSLMQLSDFNIQ